MNKRLYLIWERYHWQLNTDRRLWTNVLNSAFHKTPTEEKWKMFSFRLTLPWLYHVGKGAIVTNAEVKTDILPKDI